MKTSRHKLNNTQKHALFALSGVTQFACITPWLMSGIFTEYQDLIANIRKRRCYRNLRCWSILFADCKIRQQKIDNMLSSPIAAKALGLF